MRAGGGGAPGPTRGQVGSGVPNFRRRPLHPPRRSGPLFRRDPSPTSVSRAHSVPASTGTSERPRTGGRQEAGERSRVEAADGGRRSAAQTERDPRTGNGDLSSGRVSRILAGSHRVVGRHGPRAASELHPRAQPHRSPLAMPLTELFCVRLARGRRIPEPSPHQDFLDSPILGLPPF